ncbi:MAG: NCS2 family permease, partial [Clostridiales bacterium]|nr:NCS2 family permease [Clostridiales bacterium]
METEEREVTTSQNEDVTQQASGEAVATVKQYKGFAGKLDKFFGITKAKSSLSTEIFAGIATFLAMAYILTVNPNQILNFNTSSPLWSSVFIATALGALIGTLLMALFAKMPLAQAPGMGLNSALGGIIGGYMYGSKGLSFGAAMLMVLISGVIFLILTVVPCGRDKKTGRLIGIREKIFESIPAGLRVAIPVGIGLFIAYIGFQNAGLVVHSPFTQVELVDFTNWDLQAINIGSGVAYAAQMAIVALISLFAIAILAHFKVKGAVIIGMLFATLVGMCFGNGVVVNFDVITGDAPGITWKFWENFKNFFSFDTATGGSFFAAFHDISIPAGSVLSCIVIIISFCMIDMFDTMGTVLGCCSRANLLDEEGKPINFNKIMMSDAIATCTGAMLGTSTVTTFVESGAGVAAGGRTGMTALTTSCLFLLSIFILPIFAFIPSAAAAGALIYVGVLMMGQVKNIDFSDIRVAVPAFLTIIMMPIAYSIN